MTPRAHIEAAEKLLADLPTTPIAVERAQAHALTAVARELAAISDELKRLEARL